ncbi:eukaryotic translation initiation factor 4 gamma 3 [Pleuronectes platessa]|uniref:eukaryotic translation initiation factor 4 gamma 3 n=1 Tax=Pleuronectes platessa TaxID=8262 RepID=UPI00232A24BB|nr:eukaryotic translation initiation factor 4 gamma 3 [Pleuronectes platessa]
MQTAAIIHDCVVRLLNHRDKESVECLCDLLTTMGKVLDLEEAKPQMDEYFIQIEKIVEEGKTSSQIRLMLQAIIDLRLHNWVSGGPEQGLNTIDEQEEPREVQQQLLSNDTGRQPDPSEQRDQLVKNEEPWTTVPNRTKRRTRDSKNIPKVSKNNWVSRGPRQGPLTIVHKEAKNKEKEEQRKVDEKIQQGPWAQVPLPDPLTWGTSSKELLESPAPEELEHEGAMPRRPSVYEWYW